MRQKQYVTLLPWTRGLNNALDPAVLDSQYLTQADNIVFTTSGSRRKRGGQAHLNNSQIIQVGTVTQNVCWGTDYWATVSNAKRQRLVIASSQGNFLRSTNGIAWDEFNQTTTVTVTVTPGKISSVIFNNDLIIGHGTNTTALPLVWVAQDTGTNLVFLTNSAATGYIFTATFPIGWIVQSHRNRLLVAGDARFPDRIYYSGPIPEEDDWKNVSVDFGSIDVFPDDGDPEGITSLFPEINRGGLYVAKRTKLYYVDTSDADSANWTIELVSDGIGCVSHNSVRAVDQSDIIFASNRGIQTLQQVLSGTAIKEGAYLSKDIQTDWRDTIDATTKGRISAVWAPDLNSYLFGCKISGQTNSSTLGTHRLATLATVYGYNVETQGWFRWTEHPADFLFKMWDDSTKKEVILACGVGYVNKTNQDSRNDFKITTPTASTFAGHAINAQIRTSVIYPGEQIFPGEKHFTNIILFMRDRSECQVGFSYKIDDQTTRSGFIQQQLGANNILGTTLLGSAYILGNANGRGIKPIFSTSGDVTGVGHTIDITFSQNDIDKDLEIFGLAIEYLGASESQNARRLLGS